MKTPEWLKELRSWLGTAAILGLLVVAYLYLKNAEADRRDRQMLLQSTPEERFELLKKAAKDKIAQEAEGKKASPP